MDDWEDLVPHHFPTADTAELRFSDFCHAAQEGYIEKMQQMFDDNLVTINALNYASRRGALAAVKFLVERGADVNLRDVRGKHSLHLASSNGHLDCVKYLIDNQASIELVDKYNRSCLHWASYNKLLDIVIYLLEKGAPVTYSISNNWQPLHEAVKGGDTRIAELLIQKGAPVNPPHRDGCHQPYSPLHIAAREGHTECLILLLKNKAMVNALNQAKQTPLHEAAFKGNKECVRQLILYGADPHAKNDLERIPLLEACNQGHRDCAILLLDGGSRVNASDRCGETALHHLLRCSKLATESPEELLAFVDILLQYGANVTFPGRDDETPLMLANIMLDKNVFDVLQLAMEKPCTLRHYAKIGCRKILRCDYENVSKLGIPRSLEGYLLQNSNVFSGW